MPVDVRELVGPEMRAAVGNFPQKNRQEVGGLIDSAHERIDQVVELLMRRRIVGHDGAQRSG